MSLSEWIAGQGQGRMLKIQTLLGATRDRMLWRIMIVFCPEIVQHMKEELSIVMHSSGQLDQKMYLLYLIARHDYMKTYHKLHQMPV